MAHSQPNPDEFQGFNEARHALRPYEARAHTREAMADTPLADDDRIAFGHVDDYSQTGSMPLTAFDTEGTRVSGDTPGDGHR